MWTRGRACGALLGARSGGILHLHARQLSALRASTPMLWSNRGGMGTAENPVAVVFQTDPGAWQRRVARFVLTVAGVGAVVYFVAKDFPAGKSPLDMMR
jgi:hypothetical protein